MERVGFAMVRDKNINNHNLDGSQQTARGESVAPGLLLATPHLQDPNFKHAVVLMIQHHGEGALGMVVNHPTQTPVAAALDTESFPWLENSRACLWNGGPVMRESCWLLHEDRDGRFGEDIIPVVPGLAISSSTERLQEFGERPPAFLRFLRGVAGWGPMQLESELSAGFWISAEIVPELILNRPGETLWRAMYDHLGIDPNYLAHNHGIS